MPTAIPSLRTTLYGFAALLAASNVPAQESAGQVVVVAGKRQPVVRKLDRTVHDVANAPKTANGTAQDVLQALPELSVSADGHIAVQGNTQVTVLVDGKPAAMLSGSSDERAAALQTLSGADIASVEVITNPSAAYRANGGAIVNIVLKRQRKPGAHGQIRGSASNQGLWNVGASGDATRGAVGVHGSVALRRDGTQKVRQASVDWHNPASGRSGSSTQSSEVFVRRTVESAALGVDVAPNGTDTVSLSASHNRRRSRPLFDVSNEERLGAAATRYHRISAGPNEQSDDSASLAYTRQRDGRALKAQVQHSATVAVVDKSYRDVFVVPVAATSYGRGATRSTRRLDQATVDWSGTSTTGRWGLGLEAQRQVDHIANYQAAVDPVTGGETLDTATSNGYGVTTSLAAAYVTNQLRHGNWEALLGGRAERTTLRIVPRLVALADAFPTAHWQAFDPSFHVNYAAGDGADVKLSYRRSLRVPDPRDLGPYTTYIDARNLARGNPGLQPQRLTAWELTANAEGPRLGGSLGAFARGSRDTVTDARSVEGDIVVTSRQNGGRARSAGITGSLDWQVDAPLKLGLDGGVYRVILHTPDLPGIVRQDDTAGYVNVRAAWRLANDDVSLDAHAQSSTIAPLGRSGATSSVNVAWKHRIGKALSVTVNANDIFDGSRRTYRTDASTFRQAGFEHFVARRVYVGVVGVVE